MVLPPAALAVAEALHERVGEAGEVAGGLPRARVLDDRRVQRDDVVALLDHRLPPLGHDVVLEQHAVVPVVVRVGDPAVDLGGGEDEAAPLAQRHDLVHGHDFAGHPGRPVYAGILVPPMPIYEYRCENGHLFEVMQKMTDPPLTDRWWYPLYEKLCELEVPAMIHVSSSCNPNFHATGAHYINADTTAFMQLIQGDLFKDFPTLKFVIPHGGGAVPFHWGRYRGLAQDTTGLRDRAPAERLLLLLAEPVEVLLGGDLLPRERLLIAVEVGIEGWDPRGGVDVDHRRDRTVDPIARDVAREPGPAVHGEHDRRLELATGALCAWMLVIAVPL